MAPSQTHPNWNSRSSNSYQTIDLTLSSPEPEREPQPRPRPQHRPQPRLPQRQAQLYFKTEPRPYEMATIGMQASHPVASARNPVPVGPQQARPINPEHIKQIIDTTDPHALQRVLLELCQMSPAFSGALVRGLAPHSTSAQGMISQHRMRSQQPKIKTQDDEDSDELYEVTKRKLAKLAVPTPNRSRLPMQSHGDSSHSAPRIKHEPRERSDSSPDGDMPTTIRTPIRKPSGHPSIVNQIPWLMNKVTPRSTSIGKPPAPVTKTCIKCHEQFVEVNAPCVSHSGDKGRRRDGSIAWKCCNEDVDSPGCEFTGQHTTGEEPEEDTFVQRKRPSVSPGPGPGSSRASQKRSRAH